MLSLRCNQSSVATLLVSDETILLHFYVVISSICVLGHIYTEKVLRILKLSSTTIYRGSLFYNTVPFLWQWCSMNFGVSQSHKQKATMYSQMQPCVFLTFYFSGCCVVSSHLIYIICAIGGAVLAVLQSHDQTRWSDWPQWLSPF